MKSSFLRASLVVFCFFVVEEIGFMKAHAKPFVLAASTASDWKGQVDQIDKEIDKLTNQRNLYLAKATRLQNQGDRLQFDQSNLLDARRAWQQAQINREIATRIQEEIDLLEKQRQGVLDKNGIKNYPRPQTKSS